MWNVSYFIFILSSIKFQDWGLELTNCYYQQWWIVKHFLISIFHNSRSSPHGVLVILCSRYTCFRYRVQARSQTWTGFSVMWVFSMWTSGMDWITTHLRDSLPYTMKWSETDRFMIIFKWIMTGYIIIYLNYSGHFMLNLTAPFCNKIK